MRLAIVLCLLICGNASAQVTHPLPTTGGGTGLVAPSRSALKDSLGISSKSILPSQSGQAGRVLGTNGSAVSWGAAPVPTLHVRYTGTLANPIVASFTNGIAFLPAGDGADTVAQGQGGESIGTLSQDFSGSDSVSFDSLRSAESIGLSFDSNCRSVQLPNLRTLFDPINHAGSQFTFSNSPIDTLIFQSLAIINSGVTIIAIGSDCALSVVSLPALKYCYGGFGLRARNPPNDTIYNLVTLSMPSLIRAPASIDASPCPRLANLRIGTVGITKTLNEIQFLGAALSQASVDSILALLVSLDGTNGTTLWNFTLDLSGGTSSPPSVAGAANAAILTGRGATVTTN